MSLCRTVTTATVGAAFWVALGVSSPALAVCDAYSGGCPSPTPSNIGGGTGGAGTGGNTDTPGEDNGTGTSTGGTNAGGTSTGGTSSSPSTLPFTGGELVLMTALGAGALAGGTALVIAGRRRSHAPA